MKQTDKYPDYMRLKSPVKDPDVRTTGERTTHVFYSGEIGKSERRGK